MNRQLYESGGIMSLSKEGIGGGDYKGIDMGSRTGFGILKKITGGAKKLVKGATKAVSKIASSDVGKAALIGAAAFGIPGTSMGGLFGRASFGGAAPGMFNFGGIGNALAAGKSKFFPKLSLSDSMLNSVTEGLSKNKSSFGKIAKFAGLAGVSTFLTGTLGMSEEQAEEELARDPSKYLELYYRNLNPPTADTNSEEYEAQVREFVSSNTSEYAEGGRIGYQDAGPVLPNDPTQPVNPFAPKPTGPVLPDRMMASNMENEKILEALFEKFLDMGLSPEKAAEEAKKEFERMSMIKTEGRGLAALGGRMNYALGDTASQNAMQAASVEGLPMRQNPKGVQELDLRDNGGFIPPVGIKEKEDDIPAMLSNNEFVFTADAVRGMGEGNVNVGAQRMYDMMKKLEAGGSV